MDKLLQPDTGLVIWTIVTFMALVFILKKVAWGPLLASIEEREARMKDERRRAEEARAAAEKIRAELEAEMAAVSAKSRELLAQATKDGEALRAALKSAAEADAQKIKDKTMAELSEEKERLVRDLRKEVASLSILAAEKLMRKSVDDGVQKTVLEGFFKDLEGQKRHN
ncbi:MAG: F0F1 ATP synthase subunit B [Elusimicrobiota bacterium]